MATTKQRRAAGRNIKKAAKAARSKRTISKLPKRVRTALGKQANKVKRSRRGTLTMAMRVHELHAASTHAPLVLLPAAALVDLAAAVSGDRRQAALGRKLWWLGVGAGALAGVAGLAASQEIKAEDARSEDMMWLHGAANFMILLGATGIALWRTLRRPSVALVRGRPGRLRARDVHRVSRRRDGLRARRRRSHDALDRADRRPAQSVCAVGRRARRVPARRGQGARLAGPADRSRVLGAPARQPWRVRDRAASIDPAPPRSVSDPTRRTRQPLKADQAASRPAHAGAGVSTSSSDRPARSARLSCWWRQIV